MCVTSLPIYGCVVYACDFMVMCCHWHSIFPRLIVVLAFPCHFLDSHNVVVFPLDVFLTGAHNSLQLCVGINALEALELLVLNPRLRQTLWIPWWVELLVPRGGLDKFSRFLEGCGLRY